MPVFQIGTVILFSDIMDDVSSMRYRKQQNFGVTEVWQMDANSPNCIHQKLIFLYQ